MNSDIASAKIWRSSAVLYGQILKDHISDAEFIFGDQFRPYLSLPTASRSRSRRTAREFDLVIGGDGLHSNVRELAFGDESRFVRDLGLYLCVYTVPNYLKLDRMEMQYSELGEWLRSGARAAMPTPRHVLALPHQSGIDLRDRAQQQRVLANVYEGIGWEVPRLLELMPNADDFYFDAAAQIGMDHWSQGRVVLVGDAIAPHPCPVRARVLRSSAPMCWPENWLRHRGLTKPRFVNMRKRCVHL